MLVVHLYFNSAPVVSVVFTFITNPFIFLLRLSFVESFSSVITLAEVDPPPLDPPPPPVFVPVGCVVVGCVVVG